MSIRDHGASQLEGILSQSIAAAMNRRVAPPFRQIVRLAGAAFAVLAGTVFLMVGAYLALKTALPPHWAALIVGGGAIGLALLLWAAGYLRRTVAAGSRRRRKADERDDRQGLSPIVDALAREIKASPKEAAAIALALGAVTGSSAEFRRSIGRMFDDVA